MPRCELCYQEKRVISKELSVCDECIKGFFDKSRDYINKVHIVSRKFFKLPETVPQMGNGTMCGVCVNKCVPEKNGRGYCAVRVNQGGSITGGEAGNYEWYYDLLPTNCVADWVCPGGTGAGYPEYAHRSGPEYGYKNLAVFMNNCNFNCLFCQNWHFRERSIINRKHKVEDLSKLVTADTSCICFFGGDPTPQIDFIIKTCEQIINKKNNKILRICFETNGSMATPYLERIIEISLKTGGCIKFDLKAWNENLHRALCGATNSQTLKNFATAAKYVNRRKEPPLLIASTLLIPGYIDVDEVHAIAKFIADLDPNIPYALLGFHPHFFMDDLPVTSRNHAERCYDAAISAGLTRVRIGNFHLLGNGNY